MKALPQMPTKCNEKDGMSAWYIKHAWFRLQFNLDRLYLITFVTKHNNIQGAYRGGGKGNFHALQMFFKLKCYMQEFFCSEKMTCITSPKKNVLVLFLHPRYNNFSTCRSLKKWRPI